MEDAVGQPYSLKGEPVSELCLEVVWLGLISRKKKADEASATSYFCSELVAGTQSSIIALNHSALQLLIA